MKSHYPIEVHTSSDTLNCSNVGFIRYKTHFWIFDLKSLYPIEVHTSSETLNCT